MAELTYKLIWEEALLCEHGGAIRLVLGAVKLLATALTSICLCLDELITTKYHGGNTQLAAAL